MTAELPERRQPRETGREMGNNTNGAFAAAWLLTIGKRGFDDAEAAEAGTSADTSADAAGPETCGSVIDAEVPPVVRPQIIITVSLDELEGPADGLLL
jgi:hypothetical protein